MTAQVLLALVSFAVLDVGTLFLLAHHWGTAAALFVVALTTIAGLLACARWIRRIAEHHHELQREHGENIPSDLVLIRGSEGLLSLVALLCFLYPGLLSDVLGFLLAFPRVQAGSTRAVVEMIKAQAEREGKSVEDLFR